MDQILIIKEKDRLEYILQQKIGYGNGQSILLRSIYCLLFAEGCETIVLGLLIPQLGQQWQLNNFKKSLLITCVYIGVSVGSYIQTFSGKYGRYRFLFLDAIITSVFGVLSATSFSFTMFTIVRFFYGIGIGIALPLSATYITQLVPQSRRAYVMTISKIYWAIGCLITCFLGWIFLASGHWRFLLLLLSTPSFLALYDIYANGKESLRYLWVLGHSEQCKKILDVLASGNNRQRLSLQQIQQEMRKFQKQNTLNPESKKMVGLLNEKYCKQTIILSFSWITACFLYYGIMLMLPTILARHSKFTNNNFQYIFLTIISAIEVLSFYCSKQIIDNPTFGRKKSLYLGFFGIFFLSLCIVVLGQNRLILFLLIFIGLKIFATCCFMILYPYSAEIYETKIRGEAMGIFSLFGRLATTVLGIVGISALDWFGGMGLYWIFIFLSGIASFLVSRMPYCTLGRQLDT